MFFDDLSTWINNSQEDQILQKEQAYKEQLVQKMELTIKGWSENGIMEQTVDLNHQQKKPFALTIVSDNTNIVSKKSRAVLTVV